MTMQTPATPAQPPGTVHPTTPGWYSDSANPGWSRRWDGARWSPGRMRTSDVERQRPEPAKSLKTGWSYGLLLAALPLGMATVLVILGLVYPRLGYAGTGDASDLANTLTNVALYVAVFAPALAGAVLGAVAWRETRRPSPLVAALLNTALASCTVVFVLGAKGGWAWGAASAVAVLIAAIVLVARPWQEQQNPGTSADPTGA